jgi:hypothetical protein
MLARIVKTGNVSPRFLRISMACESGQCGNSGRLLWLRIAQSKALASLGLGILISKVGCADMFFQRKLAAVSLSTTNAIPASDLLGSRKVNLPAAKSLLSLMNSANVHSQIALLGEAAVTVFLCADKDLSLIQTNITVCYFQMTP